MMLHLREKDDIPFADEFPAPSLRHEVDTFSGAAGEDNLVGSRGAEVARQTLSRSFVSFRCARTQLVEAAMDIGVFVLVVMSKCIDHSPRFLRRSGAVK